jgi:hypothetical protein
VIKDAVITDDSCFSDDDAHPVVDKAPSPNCGSWVNLNTGCCAACCGNHTRYQPRATHPKCTGNTVPDHRPKPGVRHNIEEAAGGWVLTNDGLNIFPEKFKHFFSSYRCGTQGAMSEGIGISRYYPK